MKKLSKILGSLVFDSALVLGYMLIEKYCLTWVYSTAYVAITAAVFYAAAVSVFLLTEKRAVKMLEWPTLAILANFLLAIITKIAK